MTKTETEPRETLGYDHIEKHFNRIHGQEDTQMIIKSLSFVMAEYFGLKEYHPAPNSAFETIGPESLPYLYAIYRYAAEGKVTETIYGNRTNPSITGDLIVSSMLSVLAE